MRLSRIGFEVSFIVSIVLIVSFVNAQGLQSYPTYQELFLNDYAQVVTTVDASVIRAETEFLKADTGIELTVLTIDSINDYTTGDRDIESFATNLFNTWGIGSSLNNDGALILVAVQDRDVRIELGNGYGRSYDAMAQRVIDNYILPSFRQGNYSKGILEGSQELNRQLRVIQSGVPVSAPVQNYPISQPISNRPTYSQPSYGQPTYGQPTYGRPSSSNDGWFAGALAALFGGGGGLYAMMRRRRRYAARACQNCQYDLHLLDEISDDVFLDDGELTEEYLKSVDYDVWKCDNCNQHELHTYPAIFTSYKKCPTCTYRTMKVSRRTLLHSNCDRRGKDEITKECWRDTCDFYNRRTVSTPAQNCDDNSSSSSSFGGGSSSGGGASGSW